MVVLAEKEAGLAIIDITTAPRQQLLGMLQAEQACASGTPSTAQGTPTGQQQSCVCRATTAKPGAVTGQEAQRLSLSELSVSDPGMSDPQNWWLSAQQVHTLNYSLACAEDVLTSCLRVSKDSDIHDLSGIAQSVTRAVSGNGSVGVCGR